MQIWLVRHAPTASNGAGVFQGRRDVPALPLSDVRPIPGVGEMPGEGDRLWCSPLQRARVAAEALFPSLTPIVDERLAERDVGDWEGLDHATVNARWPGAFRSDSTLNPAVTPPGGESVAALCERVVAFLDELPTDGGRVWIVTHNGWIRAARCLAGEVSYDDIFCTPEPFLTPTRLRELKPDEPDRFVRPGIDWAS